MKHLLDIFVLLLISTTLSAQCRIQTNQRDDGTIIRYINPDRIGHSDKLILALSIQTNGEQYFIAAISIFETNIFKLSGEMTLKFENEKSSTFQLARSELTTFNGYPASITIFTISPTSLKNISTSNITMAMIELSNGVYQSIPVKMNGDILKKQYACLRR